MFGKVKTTEEAIKLATTSLSTDISNLSARKDAALSSFRKTATELATINEGLRVRVGNLADLAAFIAEEQSAASTMISDNEAVRSRILEIIGE